MKINKLINGWRLLAILAVAMSAAACSDGEMGSGLNADAILAPPDILKFWADPTTVKSGGDTKISWEVANADSIEITAVTSGGTAPDFHVTTQELSGSAMATNLTATTDFIITAKKTAAVTEAEGDDTLSKSGQIRFGEEPDASGGASPLPSESAATETTTVTVIGSEIGTSITADKNPVGACEDTIIRWTSEGTSTVVSADTGEAITAKDQCPETGDLAADIAAISAAPAVDPMPANGCAVVKPCENTVYTVNTTDGSGGEGSSSVTVTTSGGGVTARIYAGKTEGEKTPTQMQVESIANPVYISWEVEPASAKVTITAEPAASCDPVLPSAATDQAVSSSKCTITGNTTFKISAQVGNGQPAEDEVDVVSLPAVGAGLAVAEKWALEGEKIDVEMQLDANTKLHPEIVNKVLVNNAEISSELMTQLKSGTVIKVPNVVAAPPFVKVKMLYNQTQEAEYKPIPVVELAVKRPDDDVRSISSMVIAPDMTRLTGVELGGFNGGVARIYKDGGAINFNFIDKAIKTEYPNIDWNIGFFEALDTYPVAVATREGKPDEIYASVTGADMRSTDGGKKWEYIRVSLVQVVDSESPLSHPTCGRSDDGKQKVQVGTKPVAYGLPASMSQTCDILALSSGLVVLATDWGIRYEENIDDSNWSWKGKPNVGQSGEAAGQPMYGHVVNKLVKAGDKIFAAADNGVFVSTDAKRWDAFGSVSGPVWTIAANENGKTLYIGTDSGVKQSPIDSANWQDMSGVSSPVISLAIDPSSQADLPTVIAGTSTGVMITRDGGASWQALELKGGAQAVQALAIAASSEGTDDVKYVLSMGSPNGELFQGFTVGRKTLEPVESDLETTSFSYKLKPAVSIHKIGLGN